VVATKEIPEQVWADWDAGYQAAASDLDNRDEKVRTELHSLWQLKAARLRSPGVCRRIVQLTVRLAHRLGSISLQSATACHTL